MDKDQSSKKRKQKRVKIEWVNLRRDRSNKIRDMRIGSCEWKSPYRQSKLLTTQFVPEEKNGADWFREAGDLFTLFMFVF